MRISLLVAAFIGVATIFFIFMLHDASQETVLTDKNMNIIHFKLSKNQTAAEPEKAIERKDSKDIQENTVSHYALTPSEDEAEVRRKDPLYDRHHIVAELPLMKDPIEQLMLSVFETELGDLPPPLPDIPQVDEASIRATIEKMPMTNLTDSEEAKDAQELVLQVKKELKRYLDEGGNINSFLQYYCNELRFAYEERRLYQQEISKALKQEDKEVVQELYIKLNEHLEEKGIKPLRLNRRQREYLGIID